MVQKVSILIQPKYNLIGYLPRPTGRCKRLFIGGPEKNWRKGFQV
jgi:hypothetical protein